MQHTLNLVSPVHSCAAEQLLREVVIFNLNSASPNKSSGRVSSDEFAQRAKGQSASLCVSSVCYIADSPENKALLSEHGLRALCILRV